MNKYILFATGILFLSIPLAGCRTTAEKTREEQREQWEDKISRQVLELDGKIFSLQNQLSSLQRQQEILEKRFSNREAGIGSLDERQKKETAELREEIKSTRASIDTKMKIILDEIAKENERLLERIRQSRGSAVMQGYEHVVKPGESLSKIARDYGATIQAIVDANELTDPNNLRVGQKLFIPQ